MITQYEEVFPSKNRLEECNTLHELENVMLNLKNWRAGMRLKMNDDKTEFILFGNRRQLQKSITTSLKVDTIVVPRSNCIKYHGAWLDEGLTMEKHITAKCKSAMLSLYKVRSICKWPTKQACTNLVV